MNGILEQILAAIQANTAAINAHGALAGGSVATLNPTAFTQSGAQPVSTAAAPVQPAPASITDEQLMALIQPHLGNDAIKAALGVTMRSMGINALPEVQPHQIPALYQAFQGVIAQHTGSQPGVVAAQPAPASII